MTLPFPKHMSQTDGATEQDSETGPNKGDECTYCEHVLCCVSSWVPGPLTALSLGPSLLPSWTGTFTVHLEGPATEGPETSVRNWDSPGGGESCGQISRSAALVNRTLGCLAQRKPEPGR